MTTRVLINRSGATAAEFAIVVPLLILMLFGIIDAGRFAWTWNRAEKAVQMGVRMAVVTDVISTGLGSYDFVQPGGLTQGDPILYPGISPITCTGDGATTTTCTCTASGAAICPTNYAAGDYRSFNRILFRMRNYVPELAPNKLQITYTGSGLGYAGDPNGMQIAPLVTVRIISLPFRPISTLNLMSSYITNISATLTAEDSSGSQSN